MIAVATVTPAGIRRIVTWRPTRPGRATPVIEMCWPWRMTSISSSRLPPHARSGEGGGVTTVRRVDPLVVVPCELVTTTRYRNPFWPGDTFVSVSAGEVAPGIGVHGLPPSVLTSQMIVGAGVPEL